MNSRSTCAACGQAICEHADATFAGITQVRDNHERSSAGLVSLDLQVEATGAAASLASVDNVLRAASMLSQHVAELFPEFLDAELGSLVSDLTGETCDLLFGEPVMRSTDGALELIFQPSDRYLDLVAAIARDGDVSCSFDAHGWPILSLAGDTASMTEPAGVGNCASRGGVA
jgi:hypothetical protein